MNTSEFVEKALEWKREQERAEEERVLAIERKTAEQWKLIFEVVKKEVNVEGARFFVLNNADKHPPLADSSVYVQFPNGTAIACLVRYAGDPPSGIYLVAGWASVEIRTVGVGTKMETYYVERAYPQPTIYAAFLHSCELQHISPESISLTK